MSDNQNFNCVMAGIVKYIIEAAPGTNSDF